MGVSADAAAAMALKRSCSASLSSLAQSPSDAMLQSELMEAMLSLLAALALAPAPSDDGGGGGVAAAAAGVVLAWLTERSENARSIRGTAGPSRKHRRWNPSELLVEGDLFTATE